MSDKTLKVKAILIKGKKYVLVADRVAYFNETYPKGSITTKLVSDPTSEMVIVKAMVYPDDSTRMFTGYSQAVIGDGMVNKTAALENAETSAVGRALGFMGIGVIESIASADEMNKATANTMKYASEKQIKWVRDTAARVAGLEHLDDIDAYILDVLTIPVKQIPVFKVKDAVMKLEEVGAAQRQATSEVLASLEEAVDISDQDLSDLKEGKIDF